MLMQYMNNIFIQLNQLQKLNINTLNGGLTAGLLG